MEDPSQVGGKRRYVARVSEETQNHSRVQDTFPLHPRVMEPVSTTIKVKNLQVSPWG